MKKLILSSFLCFFVFAASAQVASETGKKYLKITDNKDSVYVFIFNGITSTDTIKYTGPQGPGSNANWFEYSEAISNTSNLFPDLTNLKDSTGYILVVNGKKTNVWVIDYQKHLPIFTSFEPEYNPTSQCEKVKLLYSPSLPLNYFTPDNKSYPLQREFKVKYNTQSWDNNKWTTIDTTITVSLPTNEISVPAPLCDTKFTISGDQYATDLGTDSISKTSLLYRAIAVKCNLATVVSERPELNEDSRPKDNTPISYSVPIDVQFLSNANEPVATYYNWSIYKDNELIINRTERDHRYTFTDYGTYKVTLTVSNANSSCSYTDSITIDAYEAAIQVPNVFTPNGDLNCDEFRVAYKSLLGFECWIFNRWGRKIFYWNDPQKGWNGKINGRDADEGPYFYVIKATGYGLRLPKDKKPVNKNVKSTIILKGDINLLRGGKK